MSASNTLAPEPTVAPQSSGIDWRSYLHVVPAGLDLVSPGRVMSQAFELVSNATDGRRYAQLLSETQATLRQAEVPVVIGEKARRASPPFANVGAIDRQALGQRVLEIYFAQLFRRRSALIDLWPSRIGVGPDRTAIWSPRPMFVRWKDEFSESVRKVYAGFFLGSDECFRQGLEGLGLGDSGAVLLQHLGEGDARHVHFRTDQLQSTLSEIVALRDGRGPSLHRNFVALGLFLVSLHETLAALDVPVDVRAAFARSTSLIA